MRILVVGAGRIGIEVLRQLFKNPALTVLVLDPREEPLAIREGVIEQVDFHESLTPLTLDYVLAQAKPDLVLLTTSTEDLGLGRSAGVDLLGAALKDELAAIAQVPVIEVARSRV